MDHHKKCQISVISCYQIAIFFLSFSALIYKYSNTAMGRLLTIEQVTNTRAIQWSLTGHYCAPTKNKDVVRE